MWAKPLREFHWMRHWAKGKEANDRVRVRGAMKRLMKEKSRNTVILQGVAWWGTPSGTMCHHSSCAWKSPWLKRLLAKKHLGSAVLSVQSFLTLWHSSLVSVGVTEKENWQFYLSFWHCSCWLACHFTVRNSCDVTSKHDISQFVYLYNSLEKSMNYFSMKECPSFAK